MYCPNCGTDLPEEANFCAECGTEVAGRSASESADAARDAHTQDAAAGEGGSTSTNQAETGARNGTLSTGDRGGVSPSSTGVPTDAAAIDITCQHCGKRPIEEIATGHRINGFVLWYTHKSYQLLGCHKCVRAKLWGMAAKNLVTGWWGIKAAVGNLMFTIKNLTRGAINRGPNSNLMEALEDVGVTYDFLDDPNSFDAARHSPDELYIRSFVRLGTAIMLADGEAEPEEQETIKETILQLVPDYPEDKLENLIERASQTSADIERVAEGIGELLGREGEKLVIAYASAVADAGATSQADVELVATIARGLDMDEADVEAALADETPLAMSAAS